MGIAARKASGKMVRSRVALSTIAICSCCALATVAVLALPRERAPARPSSLLLHTRSSDYHFGFLSAALAACAFRPGGGWNALEGSVSKSGNGEVPAELTRGFSAFATLSEEVGPGSACEQTLSSFGPFGSVSRGLVDSSRIR